MPHGSQLTSQVNVEITYKPKVLFVAACMGMLVFGVVLTTLGAILPSIIDRFGVEMARAGTLFTLLSVGILIGSLIFGPVVDRYGYRGLLINSAVVILVGIEGIALATSFELLQATTFLVGLGGGVINGGTNALVADISVEGRSAGLSLLGVFFGVGAFGVPFTLSVLLGSFGYSEIIGGMGALVVVPIIFFAATKFPASKQPHGFPLRDALRLIKEPVLLLFGLMLFLQSGIEITASGWSAEYFNEILGVDTNRAVFLLSLFWVGMVVARLMLGIWLKRRDPSRALVVSIIIALVGSVILIQSTVPVMAGVAILVMGAGLAAGFPVVLGLVGDQHPELSGTAFSVVLVMALTGGSLVPYVTGVIGESAGLRSAFFIVPVGLIAMALLLYAALTRLKKPGLPVHTSD